MHISLQKLLFQGQLSMRQKRLRKGVWHQGRKRCGHREVVVWMCVVGERERENGS